MANYYRFISTPTTTLPAGTMVWENDKLYTVFLPDVRDNTNTHPLSFWNDPEEDIYTFEDGEVI